MAISNGGGTATAIWMNRKFGFEKKVAATYEQLIDLNGRNAWPMWMPDGKHALLHVGPQRRAEHLDDWRSAGSRSRLRSLPTAACCGHRSAMTARRSCLSATSRSGSSTPRPARHSSADQAGGVGGGSGDHAPDADHLHGSGAVAGCAERSRWSRMAKSSRFGAKRAGRRFGSRTRPGLNRQVSWSPDSTRIVYLERARRHQSRVPL